MGKAAAAAAAASAGFQPGPTGSAGSARSDNTSPSLSDSLSAHPSFAGPPTLDVYPEGRDLLHAIVWETGRRFGMQAVNLNPSTRDTAHQQYVPATLFLAADHLQELLTNEAMRTPAVMSTADEGGEGSPSSGRQRYSRAVWELHSKIFQNYKVWLDHVDLQFPRTKQCEAALGDGRWDSLEAVNGLLTELAMYFLLWTEAANMRHCPEAMWFFYHTMAMSPVAEGLWAAAAGICPIRGARDRRLMMRNMMQADISALQRQFQHRPWATSVDRCLEALDFAHGKVPEPSSAPSVADSPLSEPLPGDMDLLEDLVAMGDGGDFLDRVITPVFIVFSYEMDYLTQRGEEIGFRLGYDDVNESLTHKDIVHRTLLALGATQQALRSGDPHAAFASILNLGCPAGGPRDTAAAAGELDPEGREPMDGFDSERAAVFWSSRVFVKTYIERRSWLSLFRTFYRLYCLMAVFTHVLMAAAFTEGTWAGRNAWNAMSSAVITHALCALIERFSNLWMHRPQVDPVDNHVAHKSWMLGKAKSGKAKAGKAAEANTHSTAAQVEAGDAELDKADGAQGCPMASARRRRRPAPLEGAPLWGLLGPLERLLVFAGLLALFVLQYMPNAGSLQELAVQYWLYAAGGYTGVVLAHGFLTMRNGYTWGISSTLRLPRCFTTQSARPRPAYWLAGDLAIGWGDWLLTALFWTSTLLLKAVFDYYVLWIPLTTPVRVLLANRESWLPCTSPYLIPGLPVIPCTDGVWLVVAVRMFPTVFVSFIDLALLYQITLIVYGVIQGVTVLDIGMVADFPSLVAQFHRAPVLWWNKLMPAAANTAILGRYAARRGQVLPDSTSYGTSNSYGSNVGYPPALPAASYLPDGGPKGGKRSRAAADSRMRLQDVMKGLSDEHVAMWGSFACAWDEIVDDLREADLVTNRERDNLRFIHLGQQVEGVRPILLPHFWTAGVVQKVVDTGLVDPQQALVLSEIGSLLLFLGGEFGLLPPAFAEAVKAVQLCTQVCDIHHSQTRERMAHCTARLLAVLLEIAHCRTLMPQDLRRRHGLHGNALSSLLELLRCLEVECQAVRAVQSRGKQNDASSPLAAAAEVLLAETKKLQSQLLADPSLVSSCLRVIHDENVQDPSGSIGVGGRDPQLMLKIIRVVFSTLTVTPSEAQPASQEAQRILTFFMASLSNKQISKPPPLHEMPSWNVITPFYEEDVLYALDAKELVHSLGCSAAGSKGMVDLLGETDDRVTLLSYLQTVYPKDWECFKERLGDMLGGLDLSAVTDADFATGGALRELGLQLQLWASFRGQLLARTVRGMMCYDKALRILARLEYPRGLPGSGRTAGGGTSRGQTPLEHEEWVDKLVDGKFYHVVAAQVYGRSRTSKDVRHRWLAEGIDILMGMYGRLKVAFVDTAKTDRGPTQFSVLVQGCRRSGGFGSDGGEASDMPAAEEVYRVRLPFNRYSARGVIVGEGKPENQNNAVIFCHGEALQTIDMNQDNHVAEALKMRNLLMELKPEVSAAGKRAPTITAMLEAVNGGQLSGRVYQKAITRMRTAEKPVAIVGFREWIFSDKAGALGSFAASSEFAFGTISHRTMTSPAQVRLHYGHPDVFNKLYCMTRGGISKATRTLHVSEDVFSGCNYLLRGARIKYKEYVSVGKGRDMTFDSINAFEIKTSGGNGGIMLSRDMWRLATRMDIFRQLHLYYSGCGHFVTTWMIMMTVFASVFSLLFVSMTRLSSIIREVRDPKTDLLLEFSWENTNQAEYVLQLGILAIVPYLAELVLEYGLVRAFLTLVQQTAAGSIPFFISRHQTSRHAFQEDMQYGGAQYIGTGRGFAIKSVSFLKLYMNYGRSHIMPGFELFYMCVLVYILKDCFSCNYAAMTWGTWLVASSFIIAPFWFNPLSFSLAKVRTDFHALTAWLGGEIDPETGASWHSWNCRQMEKLRDDSRSRPGHGWTIAGALMVQCLPQLLLAFATVTRIKMEANMPGPAFARSGAAVFLVVTALIWAALASIVLLGQRYRRQAVQQQSWRVYSLWVMVASFTILVAYLLFATLAYTGRPADNLALILFANIWLMMAVHRAACHLATRSPRARAFVDRGHLIWDTLAAYAVLGVVGALSVIGVVAWAQHRLLFSVSFAKCIRRGELVEALGGGLTSEEVRKTKLEGVAAQDVDKALARIRATHQD